MATTYTTPQAAEIFRAAAETAHDSSSDLFAAAAALVVAQPDLVEHPHSQRRCADLMCQAVAGILRAACLLTGREITR